MSYIFTSKLGKELYRLLPEVYRTRDKAAAKAGEEAETEDLAGYLDAHGHLLDRIHATFEQQFKDRLPESSQDWLLSYFAQLLAVNIVSPDSEGKHEEVSNALSWRQRKGTLKCAEEIAEAVGQMEVELQEGWKRVAMTPRIGMPIIPFKALDSTLEIDMSIPSEAARHPGLPAAMVDFRRASRAVAAEALNPASRTSVFSGIRRRWRQANSHGVPCFPESFDDLSRRTVDIRTPDARKGHYHHKRLLAYAPPPAGLFPFGPLIKTWEEALEEELIEVKLEGGLLVYSNMTGRIIEITAFNESIDDVILDAASYRGEGEQIKGYLIEDINFIAKLSVPEGDTLELRRVVAEDVAVDTFSINDPVLSADDCLFRKFSVGRGNARLNSCTILEEAHLYDIDAADCIFMDMQGTEITGVIAYSRIPDGAPLSDDKNKMTIKTHYPNRESKYEYDLVIADPSFFTAQLSTAASAVLSPGAPRSIYEGASDSGEMGYFHHGRKGRPVFIDGIQDLGSLVEDSYPLKDLIFRESITVTDGKFELIRSAAPSLTVDTELSFDDNKNVIPSLDARDCLFDNLIIPGGLARLEYCTVMVEANCKYMQASDSIFAHSIIGVSKPDTAMKPPLFVNCVRYSSIPADLDDTVFIAFRVKGESGKTTLGSNTFERPIFIKFDYCGGDNHEVRAAEFTEPGYGVLDRVTSDAIRFGAEDGGEMGVYHYKYYSLKEGAVLDKMREFLPVGIEPVLIQDAHMLSVPPTKL